MAIISAAAFTATKLKVFGFFRGLLRSPLFYIVLALIAVGGGTYLYLKKSTENQIEQAVANADQDATIATYQTREEAEAALQPYEQKAEAKATQTRRDYENVRRQVYTAPQPDRESQAPRVIVDTLNRLERLSRQRESESGVPDTDVR